MNSFFSFLCRCSLIFCITSQLAISQTARAAGNSAKVARIEFAETPLSEALKFFSAKSIELHPQGRVINFIVDPAVDQQQQISLRLNDVSIGTAMIYMIDHASLDYRIDSRACLILPEGKGELAKRSPLESAITAKFSPAIKARQVILKKIELDEATLGSIIAYIAERSAEELGEKSGINLVLNRRIDQDIPVSIHLGNVPISRVLAVIAEITAIEIRIETHAVFLDPPGTKSWRLAGIKEAQLKLKQSTAQRARIARGKRSPLGTIPNDPRSPAHPDYVSSLHPDVSKRTNSLNNQYKWVNGKWTYVRTGSGGLKKAKLEP